MPVTASPLRYPGGKTKLYNIISKIIKKNITTGCIYIEPFAGGAGLALKLLYNKDVSRIVLNDIDPNIFALWQACLYQTTNLCDLVINCKPTIDIWDKQKYIYQHPQGHTELERAFATLFLNRCNVSGVITGGAIGGREQLGKYRINARFNPSSLSARIKMIGEYRDSIQFYNMEASDFLTDIVNKLPTDHTFINIDPPYVQKGPMLYRNAFTQKDHEALSGVIKALNYKWIATYDKCDLIEELYNDHLMNVISLPYSAGQTKSGEEFIIYGKSVIK